MTMGKTSSAQPVDFMTLRSSQNQVPRITNPKVSPGKTQAQSNIQREAQRKATTLPPVCSPMNHVANRKAMSSFNRQAQRRNWVWSSMTERRHPINATLNGRGGERMAAATTDRQGGSAAAMMGGACGASDQPEQPQRLTTSAVTNFGCAVRRKADPTPGIDGRAGACIYIWTLPQLIPNSRN